MGKLNEAQQKLLDQLTQSGKSKKAVIGSGYYYDMINDAVSAGIVTGPDGRPYTEQDVVGENDLDKLFFHFEDGSVYRLTFNAGTDRGTEVWLDEQHPVDWEKQLAEAAAEKQKAEESIVPNAIDVLSHLDRYYGEGTAFENFDHFRRALMYEDYDDPEDIPEEITTVKNAFKQLQDRGLVYTQLENGQWVPYKNPDGLDLSQEGRKLLIRQPIKSQDGPEAAYDKFVTYTATPTTDDADFEMSEKPLKTAAELVEFVTGKTEPKAPNSWGPFQFLKKAANAINKAFGGKGLEEYQKYEKKLTEYEEAKYYTLKSAGYTCEKPASVEAAEREKVVDWYIHRNYAELAESFDNSIDFIGQENPLRNAEAREHIREELLKSPKLDALMQDPTTQSFVTSLGLSDHMNGIGPSMQQEREFFAAANSTVGYEVARNYLNQVSSQQARERSQADVEAREKADTISQKIGAMLNADTAPERKQAFLGALKENLSANTVDAREMRHLMQDAVSCKSDAFVNKLCDEFDPAKKGDLRHTLEGLIDPKKHGTEIAGRFVDLMPEELRTKQTAIWARMENNAPKPGTEPSVNAAGKSGPAPASNTMNKI